jgi:TetR/AcrR family transcriptional regulator, regulator of cefoperazone and chloramphenicol sensitivity
MKEARVDDKDVRNRLLEAATEICAESGFKAASVRKICERAGANLAMVNYYFGGKDALYHAVIERASKGEFMEALFPASERASSPRARLAQLIGQLLTNMMTDGPQSHVARLITWELVEPTPTLPYIVETLVQPLHVEMRALVRDISPLELTDVQVRNCVFSVFGQLVFYSHSRHVNELVAPELRFDAAGIAELAAHITAFSLRGLGVADALDGGR